MTARPSSLIIGTCREVTARITWNLIVHGQGWPLYRHQEHSPIPSRSRSVSAHTIPSCGNAGFPKLTGSTDLPLTLELLPLDALSRETWLR